MTKPRNARLAHTDYSDDTRSESCRWVRGPHQLGAPKAVGQSSGPFCRATGARGGGAAGAGPPGTRAGGRAQGGAAGGDRESNGPSGRGRAGGDGSGGGRLPGVSAEAGPATAELVAAMVRAGRELPHVLRWVGGPGPAGIDPT